MLDPIVMFFLLGVLAGLVRSELRLPPAIYDFVSVLLLLAIGLKGGVELAKQPFSDLLPAMVAVVLMGLSLPLVAYPLLRRLAGFRRVDAASMAAHYGSVSVGTYAVAAAYLSAQQITFEAYMPLFLVLLEMPAIVIGILLAKGLHGGTHWGKLAHETFLGKSIILLMGGLVIGWVAGADGIASIKPLFFDLFSGVLALFLLEMGLIAASQISSLRRHGLALIVFGITFPIFAALIGTGLGQILGLSLGGLILLGTMAASASYIAVPAAIRLTVPEANPTLSLTASLGVTFPFNIMIGIPFYHQIAEHIYKIGG